MARLSTMDIRGIRKLAKDKRREFDLGTGPIGENIFKILRDLGIQLVYHPIPFASNRSNNFSGLYAAFRDHQKGTYRFMGLNTCEYFDRQLFTLAHELYHHWEESQMKICRNIDDPNDYGELKANLFAAEFLLPSEKLEEEIMKITSDDDLKKMEYAKILRFIAQLYCDYRLPYKAIVRSLKDNEAISDDQYRKLLTEDSRNPESLFHVIGKNINKSVFDQLQTQTKLEGTDGDHLYRFVNMYEMDVISLPEIAKDLNLFAKQLSDFGLEEEVKDEDIVVWDELLEESVDE